MGIREELRWTAAKLVDMGKFAVDSAVNESLKGGMLVYGVVKGKLKGEPASHLSDNHKQQQHSVVVEEMQAKLEKMQQDMNNNIHRQRNVSSISTTEEQGHPNKFPEVPLRSSMPEVTGQRNIFIRSRL